MSDKSVRIDINLGGAAGRTPDIQTRVQPPGEVIQHPTWDERDGPIERELKRLDAEWDRAVLAGDTATLSSLMADDYYSIGPFGDISNKEEELQNMTGGGFTYESLVTDELFVRVFGETGILMGRLTIKGQSHGQTIAGQYRYTDVYERRKGKWQVVSFQATPIMQRHNLV